MIKISYEEIISKIKQKSDLTDQQISEKIKEKMDSLAGLISKEGAAHIVANEFGIKLFEQISGKLNIKDAYPGMRNVEIAAKVQQLYELREFTRKSDGSPGKVASFMAADESGFLRVVLWGSMAEKLAELKQGDIVKIVNASVRENNNGMKELHVSDNGMLTSNPIGIEIKNVFSMNNAAPNATRKKIKELNANEENIEIMGTIVQLFNPNFFEICPECGKRLKVREDGFYCDAHDKQTPAYSYVFNVVVDDGTDSIRVGMFRRTAEILLGLGEEDILAFKDNPSSYEPVKTEFLGKIIKVVGRIKQGMFNDLEFTAIRVNPTPNPKEEIKVLDKEIEEAKQQSEQETKTPQPVTPQPKTTETPVPEPAPANPNPEPQPEPAPIQQPQDQISKKLHEEDKKPSPEVQDPDEEVISLEDLESID